MKPLNPKKLLLGSKNEIVIEPICLDENMTVRVGLDTLVLLIVGVGGLGSELLRAVSARKFKEIDIIDLDRVEISNLSRQQLYSKADVGKPKVYVAKKYIESRFKCVKINAHFRSIQSMNLAFYEKFDVILCGLDTYEARRYINALLFQLPYKKFSGRPYRKPILIDGATEGLLGSFRVIIPFSNACYECTLDMETDKTRYPLCTIANTPRQPEHCVQNALLVQWPKSYPEIEYDVKNTNHVTWVINRSIELSNEHRIAGLTEEKAVKILLGIIPATVITNSIIASFMLSKLDTLTNGYEILPTYQLTTYSALNSVFITNNYIQKLDTCPLCGTEPSSVSLNPSSTINEVLKNLTNDVRIKMDNIFIRTDTRTIFMSSPISVRNATIKNLSLPISIFVSNNGLIYLTTKDFPHTIKIRVNFENVHQ